MAAPCFSFTAMAGAFGLFSDNHPSHFSGDRLVEANARLITWNLLQCGALVEGAVTELRWGEKGCRLVRRGPNLSSAGIRSSLCGTNPWKVSAVHGSSVQSVIAVADISTFASWPAGVAVGSTTPLAARRQVWAA